MSARWLDDETFIASEETSAWYAALPDTRLCTMKAGAWDANDRETFAKCRAEIERRAAGATEMIVRLRWQ